MSELIPQECDVVILKTGERVGLMDQLDETHFLPDYGVETPEQEEKTMAMMPISIDDIEKYCHKPDYNKGAYYPDKCFIRRRNYVIFGSVAAAGIPAAVSFTMRISVKTSSVLVLKKSAIAVPLISLIVHNL